MSLPSSPAVTMRSPSLAAARIAPLWALTRASLAPVSSTSPSPVAKTTQSPRNAAATTWLPAPIGRTFSASEESASGEVIGAQR
jgi:hypothetical protein